MRRQVDPLSQHDARASAGQRSSLRAANTFELSARKVLGGHGCFFEWLLLETLRELLVETEDAVSQSQLVERTGLTKSIVSYWMSAMDERGVIDRQPALDGRAYRIVLSRDGENALLEYSRRLEEAGLIRPAQGGELLEGFA